jgi:tetratricopeptide (TPR) repeat protein
MAACTPGHAPTMEALPTFDPRRETETPIPPTPTPITPTPDMRTVDQLCFDLDKYWNRDWPQVITALERIRDQGQQCGDKDPTQMLYPAYYNYGVALERRGQRRAAIDAYQQAHLVNPAGAEAVNALKKLNAFTPLPLAVCEQDHVTNALGALDLYTPHGRGGFAQITNGEFAINGLPFWVRGVNYYPARAPWRRFLTDTDLAIAAKELDLIAGAGLNTIRIFLWYDALFDCPGSGLVPVREAFERLDGVIRLAAQRNMRLIITLHDLPDLTVRPLYLHPETTLVQTLFIVSRYREEPAILAWDLRNEGDIDYTRHNQSPAAVLAWLRDTSRQVRLAAPNHLITAGWLSNPLPTDPAVDFFSFHHWSSGADLRERVGTIRAASDKPILLEEVGYNTWGGNADGQAVRLREAISAADSARMLGWVIWTAFDFPTDVTCIPPACPSKDNGEHHFGLWRVDYSPKPAVEMLRAYPAR